MPSPGPATGAPATLEAGRLFSLYGIIAQLSTSASVVGDVFHSGHAYR